MTFCEHGGGVLVLWQESLGHTEAETYGVGSNLWFTLVYRGILEQISAGFQPYAQYVRPRTAIT